MHHPKKRLPYGFAKAFIASMKIGQVAMGLPEWFRPMYNAARRMEMRIKTKRILNEASRPMLQITRTE